MILAYLLLLTGLTISAVAIYYSVVGLTAIFSAAAIPIIIMGSALEVGKLVCASWLKANWERAPRFMKYYMVTAVIVLMLITSMGIFGFLSKAHNDQTLVSGDVGSKIAIYDEKIKTAKENIEADRKQLKQMDEAVDQIMGRSSDEKGADKANAVRKSQQRDRISLAKDIETQQNLIASLNDEAAPIRAEVRKVEAEVGPIKYIAAFIYGTAPDESMLERAVTWIIILIVVVFDPLAVIMLLAAQMTFGWTKKQEENTWIDDQAEELTEAFNAEQILAQGVANSTPEDNVPLTTDFEGVREPGGEWIQTGPEFETVKKTPDIEYHFEEEFQEEEPLPPTISDLTADSSEHISELDKWNAMIAEAEKEVAKTQETTVEERLATGETYIDSAGVETPTTQSFPKPDFPEDESKKKTYMIKDPTGQIQTKTRE
jgi:Tfp pilus assembly protein PilO